MDDRIYPCLGVDLPDSQPTLADRDRRAIGDPAMQADASRAVECWQTQALEAVGDPAESVALLPFTTPPSAVLTF